MTDKSKKTQRHKALLKVMAIILIIAMFAPVIYRFVATK